MGADNVLLLPDGRYKLEALFSSWEYVSGLMCSDKTVFTLSEAVCNEDQAWRWC